MRKKELLFDVPVLAVFLLTLIDMDFGNLRIFDFIMLALIAINLLLMVGYFITRRNKRNV